MRKTPYKIFIPRLYGKKDGMYVIDITEVPFKSPYTWVERVSMSLPSGVIAGNHSHKHSEAFLAMTPGLVLYWMDKKRKIHAMNMFVEGKHFFIILPSNVPHAVKNLASHNGVMVKFANEPPGVMKRYTLI